METSPSSSPYLSFPPSRHHHHHHHHTFPLPSPPPDRLPKKRRRPLTVGCASKREADGWDSGGGLVDENMLVLRRRIHEMRMAEKDHLPPSDWMEWEKRYYASYGSDVCEALGLLQTFLMNTRPSLAVGMLVLLALSVPTSVILILMRLVEASPSILSAVHLN
ncbi:uncharacterized protein LOC103722990 [Phoenix dactylifera]|uniref:Uncharacterized protein LOC103722990 n=1 Tax=Phoenix dactylifera TaxID=42345 RepID=A0A8B7D2R3_PHODC|nr:uncharacterized protein LOC103722990 [Phoenix dactylifera]